MGKGWKIIPRPLLETILNSHAHHHKVPQPLILHGPRGVGKTTIILNRLLDDWNKGPHITGYVDFGDPNHHPWSSYSLAPHNLTSLKTQLELCLESMVQKGVRLGTIGTQQVFSILNKWHGLNTALRRVIGNDKTSNSNTSTSVLWARAIFALTAKSKGEDIDAGIGINVKAVTREELAYFRETMLSLRLAKEIIGIHQGWRANAVAHLNRTGGFSRSLANSSTDWPCLLLELLSAAAEVDYFQPKLVINNIDVLRKATLKDDSTVSAAMYHDSLLWRLIALGLNERCLPVILLTSDSYYSFQVFRDFGHPDVFISREMFGWTPQEAKMHMVTEFFSESEWMVIADVLGHNTRHLSELYALKQSSYYEKIMEDGKGSTFDDIIDAYLAYLQVTVVNPAMESALAILQRFAVAAHNGKIPKDRLRFGAAWRHPPHADNPAHCLEWAKLQLMDFIQSLVNTEFGVNYIADCSLEILDDPCTNALLEVGLLYAQRDPSFIRPISRGIQRCLVRWLVHERMQLSYQDSLLYLWHRFIRGRYYRHLMKEVGYK
ncbi:embryo defective 1381 [Tasmannia lanceolata]|uniref:embryo defective 1381 n=1 Tax=Tasmannia lanceolata TaxID=3420 RepID=UPI0040630F8A